MEEEVDYHNGKAGQTFSGVGLHSFPRDSETIQCCQTLMMDVTIHTKTRREEEEVVTLVRKGGKIEQTKDNWGSRMYVETGHVVSKNR